MLPWLSTPFGEVATHGLFVFFGIIIALVVFVLLNRREAYRLSKKTLALFTVFVAAGGLLGGRILYFLVALADAGVEGTVFTFAGNVFYGGLLGGLFAGALASRIYGLPFARLADLAFTSLPLGHALGRVGCFLAGCCYGVATDSVIGVVFPAHHPTHPVSVLPVQLLEAGFNILLFLLLLYLFLRKMHGGTYRLPAVYLVAYAAFRFLIEFYRDDAIRGVELLSTSQWISIPLFLAGLHLLFTHRGSRRRYHV